MNNAHGTDMACHLCGCPDFGSYDGQVVLVAPDWLKEQWPSGIGIDVCLALEIQRLWKLGVRTTGHCCGHGRSIGYIGVDEASIKTMKSLGYTVRKNESDPGRGDCFIPKSLGTSMTADNNAIIDQIEKADTMAAYLPATSQENVTALIKAYREMEADRNRLRNKVSARSLSDQQLADEISAVDAVCDGGFGEGGGSPGEWWCERADELEHERKRRELERKLAEHNRSALATKETTHG